MPPNFCCPCGSGRSSRRAPTRQGACLDFSSHRQHRILAWFHFSDHLESFFQTSFASASFVLMTKSQAYEIDGHSVPECQAEGGAAHSTSPARLQQILRIACPRFSFGVSFLDKNFRLSCSKARNGARLGTWRFTGLNTASLSIERCPFHVSPCISTLLSPSFSSFLSHPPQSSCNLRLAP